jgi:predicted HTH domain antitoxin
MTSITVAIPDGLDHALGVSPADMPAALRLAAAAALFGQGRLSSGAAAQLAGIPKPVFLMRLADFGIATFRETSDDLASDLRHA